MAKSSAALRSLHLEKVCAVAEHSSWRLCREMGARLGLVRFAARRQDYQPGIDHVQRTFPGLSARAARRVICRSVQNDEMAFLETLRLRRASPRELREYAPIHGLEAIERARAEKRRGVLVAMTHFGNHELAAAALAQEFPLIATPVPLLCPRMEQLIAAIRRDAGITGLHPFKSGRPIIRALQQNGVVALFCDQNGAGKAEMPLLGRLCPTITAPARLGLLTGAAVMPFFAVRRSPWLADGRFDLHLRPALLAPLASASSEGLESIAAMTLQFNSQLETMLHLHPDQ